MTPQGVAFDMDGTLLETERIARACFEQACATIGWHVDEAAYNQCIGCTGLQTRDIIMAAYGEDFPYEAMQAAWTERYHAQVLHHPTPVKEGIVPLLRRLEALEIPRCVVTSSRRATATAKLGLAGIIDYFDFLVCGGEVKRGKPHPDPFAYALNQLDQPGEACWALEDSENGVRSALSAGFTVFQVPDELEPTASVRALGHEVLSSAVELCDRLP